MSQRVGDELKESFTLPSPLESNKVEKCSGREVTYGAGERTARDWATAVRTALAALPLQGHRSALSPSLSQPNKGLSSWGICVVCVLCQVD